MNYDDVMAMVKVMMMVAMMDYDHGIGAGGWHSGGQGSDGEKEDYEFLHRLW